MKKFLHLFFVACFALLGVAPLLAQTNAPAVSLSWTDNSSGLSQETAFEIERADAGGSGTWAKIGETFTNVVTYVDTTVVRGNSYMYRVRAVNSAGASGYSETATATIPLLPVVPGSPGGLQIQIISAPAPTP